jgi:surface antigen
LLKGENFRKIAKKIHSSQIQWATCLRKKSSACFVASWVRKYAATFVVALCVLLVILFNISSGRENGGNLFSAITGASDGTNPLKNKLAAESAKKNNLATAPLSNVNTASNTAVASLEVEDYYSADDYADMYMPEPTIDNQIVFASVGPQTPVAKEKRGTKTYEVKTGDTASSIAASFGVSTSTILSANSLTDASLLKPGDKLTVLPVTGATYKIQKGDSLEGVAKKYNVDPQKVIAFNDLPADGNLKEGKTLILPDGYLSPTPTATSSTGTQLATIPGQTTPSPTSAFSPIRLSGGGSGHRFPYGYCTWYVAQRRYVPWGGNAISWLANARAAGKPTGQAPRPGAIMVSNESRWGHVALVESVSGSSFTVSEMNYVGFAKKSTRTISKSSPAVRGFIY